MSIKYSKKVTETINVKEVSHKKSLNAYGIKGHVVLVDGTITDGAVEIGPGTDGKIKLESLDELRDIVRIASALLEALEELDEVHLQ